MRPLGPAVSSSLLACGSLAALLLSGCTAGMNGGGSGGGGSTQPSVMVSVAGSASTRLGSTTQMTATVSGSSNHNVTWSVDGVAGGDATSGTISAAGLYTAPAAMTASQSAMITATSQASSSTTGSLTEGLLNPLPVITSVTATQQGSTLVYLVDVIGTGFVPGTIVAVGGMNVTTTYVSATEVTATVTVAAGTTKINVTVTNPAPGGTTSTNAQCAITYYATTATAAARILDETSFGPTTATIQHVQSVGISAYLAEQFAQPTTTLAQIPTNPLPNVCLAANTAYPCAESEWWQTAITGNDQLRQRVAFALSEMFVVSTQSIPGQAIPSFHNALANDAFGNFATIMKDVTLSPAMGLYLNMLNSAKPATGQIANENYARENMQLFTMGLYLLNQDGSVQVDGSGNPIPAYSQAQVQAFARAYTGWTFGVSGGGTPAKFPNSTADYADPMAAVNSAHDTTSKTLLDNTVLTAGQTAQQDLDGALSNIFNNANVAPFVCKQLIQHLVTSTPSAAYVSRVTAVFANNGSGVRGDMKAVITAILTDPEARAGDTNPSFDSGHLREPILFITAMMRALPFTNTDPNGSWDTLSNYSNNLNERPYRANSVFNFFPPDYVIPASTLNAPEFGIENTATVTLQQSLADSMVNNKISSFSLDLTAMTAAAANPSSFVDSLSTLFMHGTMPSAMKTTIVSAITPLTSNAQRARIGIFLVVTSPQYKVIH